MKNNHFEGDILAIMPEKIDNILSQRDHCEIKLSAEQIEAARQRATSFKNIKGDIAVIPIHGFISHRASMWSLMGLESSSELIGMAFDSAIADPHIGAVVFDINSPGGTVMGLTSVTDKIFNARGKKPIISVVNSLMASAAYFIGSASDEIVADPDSETGSIGTIGVHADYSQSLENEGIKVTIIKAGEHKGEGNPYEPLSDNAKESWQGMVNSYYETFVNAVARNRSTTNAKVKAGFGQGRTLNPKNAVSVGMIDRIGTFEQVIIGLSQRQSARKRNQAVIDTLPMSRR
jgi:signal peptide peptidase SppA